MNIVFPTKGTKAWYPKGSIIQGFGSNPHLYRQVGLPGHNGWDIVGPYGSDILAPHDGVVVDVSFQGQGYGNRVDILSLVENGIAILSTLGHMTEAKLVKEGDRVRAGQLVGKMGNSGFVVSGGVQYWGNSNPDKRGTHLHWTTKRLKAVRSGEPSNTAYFGQPYKIINYENAYHGAFDPGELFDKPMDNQFVEVINNKGKVGIVVYADTVDHLIFLSKMFNKAVEISGDNTIKADLTI